MTVISAAGVVPAPAAAVFDHLADKGAGSTLVELEARVVELSALDRLVLNAGGRRWLQRVFSRVLAELAARPELRAAAESLESRRPVGVEP
jgi:hypothetical protein